MERVAKLANAAALEAASRSGIAGSSPASLTLHPEGIAGPPAGPKTAVVRPTRTVDFPCKQAKKCPREAATSGGVTTGGGAPMASGKVALHADLCILARITQALHHARTVPLAA